MYLVVTCWEKAARLWCLTVSLSLFHWYPGSGVVLDCIGSWSLHPYLITLVNLYNSYNSRQLTTVVQDWYLFYGTVYSCFHYRPVCTTFSLCGLDTIFWKIFSQAIDKLLLALWICRETCCFYDNCHIIWKCDNITYFTLTTPYIGCVFCWWHFSIPIKTTIQPVPYFWQTYLKCRSYIL